MVRISFENIRYIQAVCPKGKSKEFPIFNTLNSFILIYTLFQSFKITYKQFHKFLIPKVKVRWSRYRPGVAQKVGRGIALLFHDRGTRRGCMVSNTPRPHFTPGKNPVPILQEAGWAPGPIWTGGKCRPHWDSIPDRLSYPAHILCSSPDSNLVVTNFMFCLHVK